MDEEEEKVSSSYAQGSPLQPPARAGTRARDFSSARQE